MRPPHSPSVPVADADRLETALRGHVAGEVRFDEATRRLYAVDGSSYRQVPVGVVAPRTAGDVEAAVAVCREHDAPILMRGAGTSLAGQACNTAVVLDVSRHLDRILELDPGGRRARVQPGVICDRLREAAEAHGLTFGPDPSTHAWCTLGGMIGNNACGVHSVMAGKTVENVEEMEVLTYDGQRMRVGPTAEAELERIVASGGRRGQIYRDLRGLRDAYAELIRQRYPRIPRRVSGYNLDELLPENGFHVARALVGTEGTCAVVLEATVRLVPSPRHRPLVVLSYGDVPAAGHDVARLLAYRPIGLEGMDDAMVQNLRAKRIEAEGVRLLPPGRAWLFVEFGGDTREEAVERARGLMADLEAERGGRGMVLVEEPRLTASVWEARAAALGASARLTDGRNTWEGWEDAAVPPERLGDYLRDFQRLLDEFGYYATLYGHFGQGLVHARIDFDLTTTEGVARYRAFVEAGADLVVRYGGSLSGEHGDGQSRAELLPRMFGPELIEAFRRFKAVWDPQGRMNPGKVVDPLPLDANLRLGPGYRLPQVASRFLYPEDDGQFAQAVGRCIGVGKCRRSGGGTMCPSYQVTREERHTTRGRAHLLAEMLEGNLAGGWRSRAVKEALDLCLACKGCKAECPAGVDVATYKAEFLSRYYEGRLRPRQAYAFGLIHRWARLAARAPRFFNLLGAVPGLSHLGKAAAGMAPQRRIPRFAPRSFTRWWARRPSTAERGRPRVLLWADTFTNHFEPDIPRAAVRVLEAAGCEVEVPEQPLCCGRPLYDYGMLETARGLLRRTVAALRPHLQAGWPVVVLEPSCAAVFRDEAVNLLPHDADVRRLRDQVRTLGALLEGELDGYAPPLLHGRALLHGHCHQKALMGIEPERRLLGAMGLEVDLPDTGCCGMAGSFGFERDHYDLSVQVGERVLLPAVRAAGEETLIVTDGFSCREQIAQTTGRRALHMAEVLALAHDRSTHR